MQESVLLVCCLDVAEQETAQWVFFFALQQWITVPAASGGRCREKSCGKERGESPLGITKTLGISWPVVSASPMFPGHEEDLQGHFS